MADEEKKTAGGGENPLPHLLATVKDIPWYYYAGAAVAGGAILFGFFRGNSNAEDQGAGATSAAGDQIPYADTISPLDYALQGAADGGGGGVVSSTTNTSATPSGSTPTPVASPSPGRIYSVVAGDTLSKIATAQGHGETWQQIYQDNQAIINATAAKYGHNTNQQNWIYAGEPLFLRNA